MTKGTSLTEHQIQAQFVSDVEYRYRNNPEFVSCLFFATLNGSWFGGNNFAMYKAKQAEGFKKGVADILYLQPRGAYAYLAIEMKRPERKNKKVGGVVTGGVEPEQKVFLDAVTDAGGLSYVCYDADEAISVFCRYMEMPKAYV